MSAETGLIYASIFAFFFGYFSRVVLRFFVRLVNGSSEDF